jgi:hypothetical protein
MALSNPIFISAANAAKSIINGIDTNRLLTTLSDSINRDKWNTAQDELRNAHRAASFPNPSTADCRHAAVSFGRARQKLHQVITAKRIATKSEIYSKQRRGGESVGSAILDLTFGAALGVLLGGTPDDLFAYPLRFRKLAAFYATRCYLAECLLCNYTGENFMRLYEEFEEDFDFYCTRLCDYDYEYSDMCIVHDEFLEAYHPLLERTNVYSANKSVRDIIKYPDELLKWLTCVAISTKTIPIWDSSFSIYNQNIDLSTDITDPKKFVYSAVLDNEKGADSDRGYTRENYRLKVAEWSKYLNDPLLSQKIKTLSILSLK